MGRAVRGNYPDFRYFVCFRGFGSTQSTDNASKAKSITQEEFDELGLARHGYHFEEEYDASQHESLLQEGKSYYGVCFKQHRVLLLPTRVVYLDYNGQETQNENEARLVSYHDWGIDYKPKGWSWKRKPVK